MKMRKTKIVKKVIGFLAMSIVLTCFSTISKAAAEAEPEQQFRELYLKLLENGDNSIQDITHLDLPYMTCYDIIEDVKNNEGFVPYQCYSEYHLLEIDEMGAKNNTPYLYKFHLSTTDEGFEERYATVKQMIAEVQSNLDDKMTDLDKLLWCHEYVVEKVNYIDTEKTEVHLGGTTLVQGYGVCEGYARALAMLLKAENIPCKFVAGGAHEWLKVQIDGEWYHVDVTWDDTVANKCGTHYFLMRNDKEFGTTMTKLHDAWKTTGNSMEEETEIISESTVYTDWYIHDVWNRMYYYDGYWYYVEDNAVKRNNIQGTEETVVYEGTNLKLTGIEGQQLKIISEGEEKELDLGEKISPTTVPEVTKTAEVTKIPMATEPPVATKQPEATKAPTATPKPAVTSAPKKKIKVGTPVIKSVTNKKGKKMKVILKKKVSGAKGYEVSYSTNKKFKKSVKKVRFTSTSKTIGKLKKNKTYYVKVRAYKKDSKGQRVYGSYSKVKKVKIKK